MNCPKCNSPLSVSDICERCGEKVALFKTANSYSNAFYNQGLEKAKVRDLTGAIISLKKSLRFYKKNIDARNLLGLVYFEIGEVVNALSEWVISANYSPKDNDASEYIHAVQENPTKLETINQTIKKYNIALLQAKQKSDDLAILQLKKVLSLNGKFLRAYHLLALLYMRNHEIEKARKLLQKAINIDMNNTTTLRYIKEVESDEPSKIGRVPAKREIMSNEKNETTNIMPVSSYKEDKPSIMIFVNLIIGIMIGIAVVYGLIVPNKVKNLEAANTEVKLQLSEELSSRNVTISTLESKNNSLESRIASLEKQINQSQDDTPEQMEIPNYDDIFTAFKLYLEEDKVGAADILIEVKKENLQSEDAKAIYETISEAIFADVSETQYNEGHANYTAGRYEESKLQFEKAIKLNPENVNAIYFLARSHHQLGNLEEARTYYNLVVDDYPTTKRASEAKAKLREIPE